MKLGWLGYAIVVVLSALIGGCGSASLPSSPSAATPAVTNRPADPVPIPTPPASTATIAISAFTMTLTSTVKNVYWYTPSFVLNETSGLSGATIQHFRLSGIGYETEIPGSDAPPGTGCLITPDDRVVRSGGRWSSESIYLYCRDLDAPADVRGRTASLTVVFTDDQGHTGSASRDVTIN